MTFIDKVWAFKETLTSAKSNDLEARIKSAFADVDAAVNATANNAVAKTGSAMTGLLTLAGDPTAPLHPATRQYVLAVRDALVSGAPGTLDTLGKIATALQADEAAAVALTSQVNALASQVTTNTMNVAANTAAIVGKVDKPGTKTSMISIATGYQGNTQSLTEAVLRQSFESPFQTKRWRLLIANYDTTGKAAIASGASFLPVYIGPQAFDTDGLETGNMASAPIQVLPAFTLAADGSEYVSPWITDADKQLPAGVAQILSIGFTGGSTQDTAHGKVWRLTTAGSSAKASAQTDSGFAAANGGVNAVFDIRIQYDWVGSEANYLVIGDSRAESAGSSPIACRNRWPEITARTQRVAVANGATAGGRLSVPYNDSTTWAYQRMRPAECNYDAAIIDLGINDVNASALLAALKTSLATVIAQLAAIGIKRYVFMPVQPNETINSHGVLSHPATAGQATIRMREGNNAAGQSIRIGGGANQEVKVISSVTAPTTDGDPIVVVLTTNLANRHYAGEVVSYNQENQRLDLNAHLRGLPFGALSCGTSDRTVSAPYDDSSWDAKFTVDHLHALPAGHPMVAAGVPRLPRTFVV